MLHPTVPLGIYEKALPADEEWPQRLTQAAQLGFDFVEMSIDESDRRLARLSWSRQQRLELLAAMAHSGVRIPSLCLSAHRRFPLGSEDQEVRRQALRLLAHAITLAQDLGIRVIQLAGYDVYYQQGNPLTRQLFREGLSQAVTLASRAQVTLAMETMDTPLLNSISKALGYCRYLRSPWFQIYPDIGNLSAWDNDVELELAAAIDHIVAVHVKDTRPGQFRDVPFGSGVVDFEACFRTLDRHGYRGPYLIEMWNESAPGPLQAVREARDWVMERMRRAGLAVAQEASWNG
ncbi:L-ribulose-5-phosphate 3-epimerase [Edwardsiella ictaluri]|uniref:L-ribulose-5-phosphate 3-epimerase n=2 Tax=Edwardsiella ictaluri TaxID=67780 RepID=C5B950_EDWI9|nr:L-ribulose-5-phosphate 3-epimerase [Edwardsiella ictaluri]ACR70790.1 L-xylulose 5-phosphate 3-epimerase, putative [Edwardsiella ictaluri 93-146]AVZ82416.1 L-ribulose-5-phosphate 3-epimerase [Edwardsiella ictaluri]EKS7762899.1 L-ribulose-5-phosphate 3-epimerase [Edwardsiella ictaluri]EKS7769811.1 L-ribulose-5-phosphate 3-epimerase [Edwardsiella ictaluri]EKS7772864.1 L-ribulose-5-phosphate 3-epimerase [Edwardsiella ictaluri]